MTSWRNSSPHPCLASTMPDLAVYSPCPRSSLCLAGHRVAWSHRPWCFLQCWTSVRHSPSSWTQSHQDDSLRSAIVLTICMLLQWHSKYSNFKTIVFQCPCRCCLLINFIIFIIIIIFIQYQPDHTQTSPSGWQWSLHWWSFSESIGAPAFCHHLEAWTRKASWPPSDRLERPWQSWQKYFENYTNKFK